MPSQARESCHSTARKRSSKRTRSQRSRTAAKVSVWVEIRDPYRTPIYQEIAAAAAKMRTAGASVRGVALHFGVDHHTADKALRWFRDRLVRG